MTVKTAISLDKALFDKVEALSKQLDISRSHLFALAAQEFIERHENQRLFEAFNKVYDDRPDPQEHALREKMRDKHRRMVKGQW